MGVFAVVVILIAVAMFALFAMVMGFALFAGIFWLGLVLIQLALGAVLYKLTGKKVTWLMSKKTFAIEAVIAVAVVVAYFNQPVNSGELIPEACSSISYSTVKDDGGEGLIVRSEQISYMMNLLDNYELHRRLNLRFLNEGTVMHDTGGVFLYLRDEDGSLLKKVRIYGDLFGVSDKEDGDFIYYRAEGEINNASYQEVIYMEEHANTYEFYQDSLEAFSGSWTYADGTFTFTIPEWGTDDWRLTIDGKSPILDENGERTDTDYIAYLKERSDAGDWTVGETVQFTLTDAPLESLTYTVKLDGFSFDYSLLEMVDEQYVWKGV